MDIQKTTLNNGLTVLMADTKAFPTVTILVLVGVGSRFENKENAGVAHFFEHMAFKGSSKFKDALTLSKTIEGLGAEYNAYTSKEQTAYYIKLPVAHAHTAIQILADMVQHPLLKPEEIEKERGVILEELNMYEDMPNHKVARIYTEAMFPNNPLGLDIGGNKKTVGEMDQNKIRSFLKQNYGPEQSVIIVSGGFSEEKGKEILREIKQEFSTWKKVVSPSVSQKVTTPLLEPVLKFHKKETEQAHFIVGYRGLSYLDSGRHALQLMSLILGGGMSSRLFHELREQRGLCYYIYTSSEKYADTGSIYTAAGVTADVAKIKKAIELVKLEHEKIATKGATQEELTRVKEYLKGNILLSFEDSYNIASFLGKHYLHTQKVRSIEEALQDIDAVELNDIKKVAKRVVDKNQVVTALVGSENALENRSKV